MSSGTGSESSRGSKKNPSKSGQLESTLKELENAFADWESLGSPEARAAAEARSEEECKKAADSGGLTDEDVRKRTRKLLNQLRDQLEKL